MGGICQRPPKSQRVAPVLITRARIERPIKVLAGAVSPQPNFLSPAALSAGDFFNRAASLIGLVSLKVVWSSNSIAEWGDGSRVNDTGRGFLVRTILETEGAKFRGKGKFCGRFHRKRGNFETEKLYKSKYFIVSFLNDFYHFLQKEGILPRSRWRLRFANY